MRKNKVDVVIIVVAVVAVVLMIVSQQIQNKEEELPVDETSPITTEQGPITAAYIPSSEEVERLDVLPPITMGQGQPTVPYTPSSEIDQEGEGSDATDEVIEVDEVDATPLITTGQSTVTYTPSSEIDQEVERFGVTGKVLEIDVEQNFLKIVGNNQSVYTVVILHSTEITKSGSKIALSEIQVGDDISAITSENIQENLNFEAESVYIVENLPLLLGL